MRHADTLYAFAQIAIALAGFAGLMAFVRSRSVGPLTVVHRNRLVGMVRVALIATAFSLVPVVISSLGTSDVAAWRVSGALLGFAWVPITVVAWRRLIALRKQGLRMAVPLVPHTATLAAFVVMGSAVMPNLAEGLYLVGVFLVLLVSGALFFSLVVSLLDESDS